MITNTVRSKSTQIISQHIGSDLKLIMSILQGMADSPHLQQGELYGDNILKLLKINFLKLIMLPRLMGCLLLMEITS